MTIAFLNGSFFGGPDTSAPAAPPLADARISAFDAGFQHSVGLFETLLGGVTLRGIEGATSSQGEEADAWALHLDEHMERLAISARELGLSDQLRTGALADAVIETIKRSRLPRARVRLTITGGDLSLLNAARAPASSAPKEMNPTLLIVAQPATEYPEVMFEKGVLLTLADTRANPLNHFEGHKTLNYWWRLRELQLAARKGAGEALVLSVTNHLVGGCVSNVIAIKGDEAFTPIARGEEHGRAASASSPSDSLAPDHPSHSSHASANTSRAGTAPGRSLPSPVLPGVTRAWALERLERWGLKVHTRMMDVQSLLDADEVVLTNSSWGVLPIAHLEGSAIGAGAPGKVARDLRDAWLQLLPTPIEE